MEIIYNGKNKTIDDNATYHELADMFQKDYANTIALAYEDGKLRELFRPVKKGATVSFETLNGNSGHKSYKRTACMILLKALYDVIGTEHLSRVKIEFSIGKAYYCSYEGDFKFDETLAKKVKDRMQEIVDEDIPVNKVSTALETALKKFADFGMNDKVDLFKFRRSSSVNIYSISHFEDYYYGFMLPSTGYVKWFDLVPYDEGMMLILPERSNPENNADFTDSPKLFDVMKLATQWNQIMGVETVGQLNNCICKGGFSDLVMVQEALQEKKIADIAADIISKGGRKFIMIAGPSSSGKTSFSHRLSIQLRAQGMKPHPIALDNYFIEREFTPRDADGKYDYECLEALNIELFNQNMTDLLAGKTVELPRYNFISGKTEYKGDFMTLGEDDILVIEGIHGLNDKLSYSLPMESKYKIYISALTTLNVDEHNRIPTTDVRLLRRMVRDFRTRGASAQRTLDMWASVRRGEDNYIFPFQESADAMFNSAMIYEISVLKQYAEPLLFGITRDEPEYAEAQRLLKFLEYFLGVSTEGLPNNSIVREFVGGSVFPV